MTSCLYNSCLAVDSPCCCCFCPTTLQHFHHWLNTLLTCAMFTPMSPQYWHLLAGCFVCQSLWGSTQPCQQPTSPHQSDHQTLPPPSTLPFSVHRLHFLMEITLPHEWPGGIWYEIKLEAERYSFSLFFLQPCFPYTRTLLCHHKNHLHTILAYQSTFNNSLATLNVSYGLLAPRLSTSVCL